jgi:hypothetical protein
MTLKLRREDVRPEHFQVYSGEDRIGTIYCTHQHPGGNEWMWFFNGITNGPVRFNGFAVALEDAKAEFAASWRNVAHGRRADRRHERGGITNFGRPATGSE